VSKTEKGDRFFYCIAQTFLTLTASSEIQSTEKLEVSKGVFRNRKTKTDIQINGQKI